MFTRSILRGILGSITAQKCPICDDVFLGLGACEVCFSLIKRRLPPLCETCGRKLQCRKGGPKCIDCLVNAAPFDRLWTEFDYEPVAGYVIQYAKKWGLPAIMTWLLATVKPITDDELSMDFDGIVAIPDRHDRYRRRGFSTSAMIANRLSELLGDVPTLHTLTWARATERQSGLSKKARLKNMEGAFIAHNVSGKVLLIVDDVYTTGSTLKSASRALKRAGAKTVNGFALAHRCAPY
jgi:ComF family protein